MIGETKAYRGACRDESSWSVYRCMARELQRRTADPGGHTLVMLALDQLIQQQIRQPWRRRRGESQLWSLYHGGGSINL